MTKSTAGMPSFRAMVLSIPFWNKKIFERLLNTWKTAVMPKTNLKSMKIDAKGTNRIEEPKPLIVPMISANKANKKKR